jgi:hypothetical protein
VPFLVETSIADLPRSLLYWGIILPVPISMDEIIPVIRDRMPATLTSRMNLNATVRYEDNDN